MSGIRECSAEVRVAVACLKESTQLGIGSTECQLTTFSEKSENLSYLLTYSTISLMRKASTNDCFK